MPALSLNVPGVHLRVIEPEMPPPLAGIAGLVGQAERGPLNDPQLVTRWGEFLDVFGGFTSYSYLAYAVFAFFHTGGERCRVVRVAHETATSAAADVFDTGGARILTIRASSEGDWGRDVAITVEPRSTSEMPLTKLAGEVAAGALEAMFRSVAGLSPGDEVSLVDARDPRARDDRVPIQSVDRPNRRVVFTRAIRCALAAGAGVVGRGFRLVVRAPDDSGQAREEVFDQLSLSPEHPRYVRRVVNGDPPARDFVARAREGTSILVAVAETAATALGEAARPQSTTTFLEGGNLGPVDLDTPYYTGRTDSGYFRPVAPGADAAVMLRAEQTLFGLSGLEAATDVELVAIPDLALPDIYRDAPAISPDGVVFTRALPPDLPWTRLCAGQRQMLQHCARMGDRLAILDAPPGARITGGRARIDQWPAQIGFQDTAPFGALYHPWLRHRPIDFDGRDLFVPPCGHVAGVYAGTGRTGPGKPPANEPLSGVVELETVVDDADQEALNPRGVNCIRVVPGRGPRIWGARTLSADPRYRYVNVRRLTLFIVRRIAAGLQWAVFEPHDTRLRGRVAAALTEMMNGLLRAGALGGARPDQAFFVQCDAETTPPDAEERGELVARVGFVPAGTAELIVVTIQRTPGTLAVTELGDKR